MTATAAAAITSDTDCEVTTTDPMVERRAEKPPRKSEDPRAAATARPRRITMGGSKLAGSRSGAIELGDKPLRRHGPVPVLDDAGNLRPVWLYVEA